MAEKKGGILKWVLLLGCGGVLFAAVACTGIFFLIFSGVRTAILASPAYQEAMEVAQEDAEEHLGSPVKPGYLVSGSINTSGSTTDVDVQVPLEGPDGKGTLIVRARCYSGVNSDCDYDELTLLVPGERIDLLEWVDEEERGE